jgi:putative transposase
MNRGANRSSIFIDDNDRIEVGQRLCEINELFGIDVHAYCLMGNHFHLLLHCPHGGVSPAMQRFSSLFTRHVNDRHGRDGSVFRGRFHSRVITDETYLLNACRYIHRNPLDIDGVNDLATYRWSSHRTYLGLRRRPPWLTTSVILDRFDHDRFEFDRFVQGADHRVTGQRTNESILAVRDAARLVLHEVTATTEAELSAMVRLTTLAVIERLGGFDRGSVAEVLEIPTPGALRTALSRAHAAVANRDELRRAVEITLSLVG